MVFFLFFVNCDRIWMGGLWFFFPFSSFLFPEPLAERVLYISLLLPYRVSLFSYPPIFVPWGTAMGFNALEQEAASRLDLGPNS